MESCASCARGTCASMHIADEHRLKTKTLVFSFIRVYLRSSVAKILFRLFERRVLIEFIHIDLDTITLAFQKVCHRTRELRVA